MPGASCPLDLILWRGFTFYFILRILLMVPLFFYPISPLLIPPHHVQQIQLTSRKSCAMKMTGLQVSVL